MEETFNLFKGASGYDFMADQTKRTRDIPSECELKFEQKELSTFFSGSRTMIRLTFGFKMMARMI